MSYGISTFCCRFQGGSLPSASLASAKERLGRWSAVRRLKGAISTAVALERLAGPAAAAGRSGLLAEIEGSPRRLVLEQVAKHMN